MSDSASASHQRTKSQEAAEKNSESGWSAERPNAIGYRAKIGVILPSTNTAVEYDLQRVRIPGVTWHPSRFWVEAPTLNSDDAFEYFLSLIRHEIPLSIRNVLTCKPTQIMMGMSAETFWGGQAGNAAFVEEVRRQIGALPLTTGANACAAALERIGAKRIAVLTPYQEVGDEQVRAYFTELGYEVKGVIGLRCPSATAIAETPERDALEAFQALNGPDVDTLLQVGTNLSTLDIAPTLEKLFDKPCLPINVVSMWHALRSAGINEPIDGLGCLFERY